MNMNWDWFILVLKKENSLVPDTREGLQKNSNKYFERGFSKKKNLVDIQPWKEWESIDL